MVDIFQGIGISYQITYIMAKSFKPGERFNKFQAKKGKLRSAASVVKSEQNASHQFTSTKKVKNKGKVKKVMGEFKRGALHSGSKKGPKVSSRKQAVAIALSEARKGKK